MGSPFLEKANELRHEMVALRRDLHQHPELAFQEVRTARVVAEELARLGFNVQTGVGKTGVVGFLDGVSDGPTLLIRADMDALPVQEENNVPYASQAPGIMHACGHDAHTAIGLTVARIIAEKRDKLAGCIKLVFQPAEEVGEGALAMIADGVLANPRPDIVLGLHLWNDAPIGHLSITPGPFMASNTRWTCLVEGFGGHGAQPHLSRDPIIAAAHIITALQTIVSRNTDPLAMAVLTVGAMNGGETFNVIPSSVTLKGTIRAYEKPVQEMATQRLNDICARIAAALQCEAHVSINAMTIPVVNDPQVTAVVSEVANQIDTISHIADQSLFPVSDDMAFLLEDIPGCYFMVGSARHGATAYPHHHPLFEIDEEALVIGAAVLFGAASHYIFPDGFSA